MFGQVRTFVCWSTSTWPMPDLRSLLLIADLRESERSKTKACAFSDNGVAYKLDVSHMTSFSESNECFKRSVGPFLTAWQAPRYYEDVKPSPTAESRSDVG